MNETHASTGAEHSRQALGRVGEELASGFLRRKGHVVLSRNWRCRWGEIDLVTRDRDCIVFTEVKTRSTHRAGHPFEALTHDKVSRLRRLAGLWCQAHPQSRGVIRIDAIAVTAPTHSPAIIEHLESVTS